MLFDVTMYQWSEWVCKLPIFFEIKVREISGCNNTNLMISALTYFDINAFFIFVQKLHPTQIIVILFPPICITIHLMSWDKCYFSFIHCLNELNFKKKK